jgi:hypothetical protein
MHAMSTRRPEKSNDATNQEFANPDSRSNDLRRFATWSAEEHRQFEESIASLEEIDVEMWVEAPPL